MVEGTVPSQWYLDMKAERDALREALEEIADLPWYGKGQEIARAALERPE